MHLKFVDSRMRVVIARSEATKQSTFFNGDCFALWARNDRLFKVTYKFWTHISNPLFVIFLFLITYHLSLTTLVLAKDPGATGFNFLKIGVGARQMAMGNSAVAVNGDVNSFAYNPATLGDLTQQEIGFLYTRWLEDISYQYAAYAYPHSYLGTLGLSMHYLSFGEIQGYDRFNRKISNPTASDLALGLSYAKVIKHGLSLGLTYRYVQEELSAKTGKGYGFDLGTLYRLPGDRWWSNIALGLSVKNLGPKVTFITDSSALPLQTDFGLSYTEWQGKLIGTVELHKPVDADFYISLGAEFKIKGVLSFRAGYRTERDIGPTGVSAGFGLALWEDNLNLDYAFVPFERFNNVHRVGISYRFGGVAQRHYKKGVKLMRSKKYAEAILEFDKALQQNPNHSLAARYMRRCASELKKEEQSE